jgi:hypothetical protein
MLDEETFEQATLLDPLRFRERPGEPWSTTAGELRIRLRPYAYVRIDGD